MKSNRFGHISLLTLLLLLSVALPLKAQQAAPAPQRTPALRQQAPKATATPKPAPAAPTAVPAAPAGGQAKPAVPLQVLDKDQALTQLRPAQPEAKVELIQVRIMRVRDFAPGAGGATPINVASMKNDAMMQDVIRPGLSYLCRITTPPHCGIIDIKDARLSRVLDRQGQPVRLPAGSATATTQGAQPSEFSSFSILSWDTHEAMILLTGGLPPRADDVLSQLEAEFTVELGTIRELVFPDLRKNLLKPLLPNTSVQGISMMVTAIAEDQIVIVSEGQTNKLGQLRFEGINSEPVNTYATFREVQTVPPDNRERVTTTYSFFNVPQLISAKAEFYPEIETKKLKLMFSNVPLP